MKEHKDMQTAQTGLLGQRREANHKQASAQPNGFLLIHLPADCLQLICQHMDDNNMKLSAMRSCRALHAAVLGACRVLLQLQFPWQHWGMSGPLDPLQLQASLLQQATHVALEFHFDDEYLHGGKPRAVGDMSAWLAKVFRLCKGAPLTSVSKLVIRGAPKGVLETLPDWVPIQCPNLVHLVMIANRFDTEKCHIDVLTSRVYQKLKSVELRETCVGYCQEIVGHMSALLDAPQVTHMALTLSGTLKQSFAHRECHLKTLQLLDRVVIATLLQLPCKGVEHLVLGNQGPAGRFLVNLRDMREPQASDPANTFKEACAHLNQFSNVTLSTDAGVQLQCIGTTAADAISMLPLLRLAKPYKLTPNKASGVLRVSSLETVTKEFIEALCSSLQPAITKVTFFDCYAWQKGALEVLLPLLPTHVTGFAIVRRVHDVSWSYVKAACNCAVRPIAALVPTYHPDAYSGYPYTWSVENAKRDIAVKWPGVVESMHAHGHQHVSWKMIDYHCC